MKYLLLAMALLVAGCANQAICGDSADARTVYFKNSCRPRIREVIIGSELKIPSNIKKDALANFDLKWMDPSFDGGKVSLGHYDLVPKNASGANQSSPRGTYNE